MLYASISAVFGTLLLPLARPNKQLKAVEVRKMIINNQQQQQQLQKKTLVKKISKKKNVLNKVNKLVGKFT